MMYVMLSVVQERHAEADPLYQRSQAIREKALGPDHLDVSHVLNDRALSMYQQARLSKFASVLLSSNALPCCLEGPSRGI